jgi:hypothetical protein
VVLHLKAKNIKFNFCCNNVQISLIMSQQIQSDIFRTQIITNELWYQIAWGNICRIEKNPIMISPYCIFEVDKLVHDGIFFNS